MKKLIIAVVVVVAGAGLYFSLGKTSLRSDLNEVLESNSPGPSFGSAGEADVFAEPVEFTSLKQTYSGTGFSIKYPDGFKVSSNPVSATEEIVTVENPKGSGFQVFIMLWDEPDPITPERIWQDIPDADVLEPKNAELDGAKTLVFYGYNEDMGETFEAWAVYKGKLYQIAGPKTAEELITKTLETWSWPR